MADRKKCAHPSCSRPAAADSKFCSTECEAVAKTPDQTAAVHMPAARAQTT